MRFYGPDQVIGSVHILQYNNDTDAVELNFDRYTSAGIDLAALHIGIITDNGETIDRIIQFANTDTITVVPNPANDRKIIVTWKIGLNTTIKPSQVSFVVTFADDDNNLVWQDGPYIIRIDPTIPTEQIVAQYPSILMQYETAMRKLYADAQTAVEQAEAEAQGAEAQANRAKTEADRAETAREDVSSAKTEIKDMQETVAANKSAVEAAQKDVEKRQTEINTAYEDVKTKTTAVLSAAEQVESDKKAVEQAVTAFDETVTSAVQTIDSKEADVIKSISDTKLVAINAIKETTAEAETTINNATSTAIQLITQQSQDITDTVNDAKTDIASMVSSAQASESAAAQSAAQAAQSAQEAQAAADSIGDAISPALLTATAAGTGAVAITNTADYPLQSLAITGATQRDVTPEPDNPVYPVSLGDSGAIDIMMCGRNLIDWEGAADYSNWRTTSLDADHPYGAWPYLIIDGFVPGVTYTIAVDSLPELREAPIVAMLCSYPGGNRGETERYPIYNETNASWRNQITIFTATRSQYYINCYGCTEGTVSQVVHDWLPNLRIYQGSYTADTIPPYEPYRKGETVTIPVDRPIMRIGSAADRVDFTTGKIVRAIQELSIGESAAWYDFKTYDTGYCTVAVEMPTLKGSNGFTGTLCNYFIEGGRGAVVNRPPVADGFALIPSGNHARLHVALAQSNLSDVSLDGFKVWLSSHPMRIWAEAVDLTEEQIEPADLRSYDSATTISVYGTSGEPFPEIEAKAVLDATTVVADQQEQINKLREMINNLQSVALAAEIGGTQ